jgi:hypothetical protein
MKRVLKCWAAIAMASVAVTAMAAPEYVTTSGSGTTAVTVYWPADAVRTPRIVGVIATSDKAASVLSIRKGTTAYTPVVTNLVTTSTTQWLNTTNGLAANDVVILQKASGTCYSSTVASVETNMVTLASGGFGATVALADQIYKLSAASTIKVGSATVNFQGPAIYAGDRGRPLRVVLDGTSACSVDSATAAYE